MQFHDEEGAFDATLLPCIGGDVVDVDDGVGGEEGYGDRGGKVSLKDGEVEGFVCRGGIYGGGVFESGV